MCMQEHLQEVLPSILDGLADEAEGVRDAALAAGRTFVDLYAETALPLLLPAVEDGILNDNWRIRQSSVELLGQLLFKVSLSVIMLLHAVLNGVVHITHGTAVQGQTAGELFLISSCVTSSLWRC